VDDLLSLKEAFLEEIGKVANLQELQNVRARYTGRKGLLAAKLKALSSVPPAERPGYGKKVNEIKDFIEEQLGRREEVLKAGAKEKILSEAIDITLPGRQTGFGSKHPINIILAEITGIFASMGFSVEDGPEIELDYFNFEALNIPRDHPARDMQDTFYVGDDVVLRTHTSPVQARVLRRKKPPLKFIAPGKVYRCDADVSHTPMFHQVEGMMVDVDISFADLKGVLELFIHSFFGKETPVRFRPSYFPFTEPSAEVDMGCIFCKGAGCRVCKSTGWLEVLGAGLVNPKVLEMAGCDFEKYSGFAFGIGIERMTMLRYSIDDIRLFYEDDMRFLRQF
jgi:phenylalanyl-tRNA synthetase alpha chain